MPELPNTLENAIAQAIAATQAAIRDGHTRLQVELLFPELKPLPVAQQFLPVFEELGAQFKVFFPDAGTAALARRDWGESSFKILDIGIGKTSARQQVQPEDKAFLFVAPTAVEVTQVEKLCEEIDNRPFVMLNPCLEDAATVGIGYTGRQLRYRFLNTIESCYHLKPLDGAALFRCYPAPWQFWLETSDDYQMIAELPQKPTGEEIDSLLAGTTPSDGSPAPKKVGLLTSLQRFLRALSR
ncbi:MAG: DUF1995 family protein [Chroococcidiopsidaceae cyanobacterium CP_BM_ER_R8_30]|nr:DUF1995 family protein [Chroococcidiopsidaceae cyanobacterium CP_BM_ER_R8_30]